MRLRRRADRERVRETLRELGPRGDLNERIVRAYGHEIVRQRIALKRALDTLPVGMGGDVDRARDILRDALQENPAGV